MHAIVSKMVSPSKKVGCVRIASCLLHARPPLQVPTTWTAVAVRLWELSWPLSGMEVLTFAKELIITAFVGHLGSFQLSSLVLAQTLYNVRH